MELAQAIVRTSMQRSPTDLAVGRIETTMVAVNHELAAVSRSLFRLTADIAHLQQTVESTSQRLERQCYELRGELRDLRAELASGSSSDDDTVRAFRIGDLVCYTPSGRCGLVVGYVSSATRVRFLDNWRISEVDAGNCASMVHHFPFAGDQVTTRVSCVSQYHRGIVQSYDGAYATIFFPSNGNIVRLRPSAFKVVLTRYFEERESDSFTRNVARRLR